MKKLPLSWYMEWKWYFQEFEILHLRASTEIVLSQELSFIFPYVANPKEDLAGIFQTAF